MTNILEKPLPSYSHSDKNSHGSGVALDTSVLPRKPLHKRAQSKHFTNKLAVELAELRNEREQYYRNAFYCNHILTQVGNKITGKYCKTRICNTCNRIRMANLIEGYNSVLSKYNDLQFVTLTVPNCPGQELPATIVKMQRTFTRIVDRLRKRGIKPSGLRKLEITYNSSRSNYHPHYHLVVSGVDVAKDILAEWLISNPNASEKAQDIRAVTNDSLKELFKYTAKVVTTINGKQTIVLKAVDTIIASLHGRRIIQPFGEIRKEVSEDIEEKFELDADLYDIPYYELMSWMWRGEDWCNEYGELLTGYNPSQQIKEIGFDYS